MAYFRVEKLVKKFGGLTAVNGVTFDVEKGEIFGLIGPERLRENHDVQHDQRRLSARRRER